MSIVTTIRPSYPLSKSKGIYDQFPNDMDDWSCMQWIQYHKNILYRNGRASAKYYLENDGSRIGMFADVNNCKYDCSFVEYFRGQGIDVGNIFSNIYCAGAVVVKSAKDTAESVSNVVTGVTNTTKVFKSGNLFLAGLLGVGIYYINKKTNENGKKRN